MTLGEHLREMRDEAGMTRYRASIDATVHQSSIRRYETDKKIPTFDTLERLLEAYGYEIEFMKVEKAA